VSRGHDGRPAPSRGARAVRRVAIALLASVGMVCVAFAACTPIDTPGPERLDADEVDDQMVALPEAGFDGGTDAGDAGAGASCAADAACRLFPDANF
jgi:hypothetical protein